MKRTGYVLLLVFFLSGMVRAGITDQISVRINGGIGLITKGGDIKDYFASTYKRWAFLGHTGNLGNEYKPLGFSGTLELAYPISKDFSIGLGTGYIAKKWTSEYVLNTMYYKPTSGEHDKGLEELSVGSIPVLLTGYYHYDFNKMRFNVGAGAGAYLNMIKYHESWDYNDPERASNPNLRWIVDGTLDADTKTAFGFHATAGASMPVAKNISIEINALYRIVSFDDFSGSFKESSVMSWTGTSKTDSYDLSSAKLWLKESYGLGMKTLTAAVDAEKPTTSETARLFKIDLTGFYFNVGVMINLNLLRSK